MTTKNTAATPAATPDAEPVVSSIAIIEDDRTVYLYRAQTDAGNAPFVIRKARGKGAATRPLIFDPNGASVVRYTTDAATVRAYLAEKDAEKRAAMLDGLTSREQDSRITPDVALVEAWAALIASTTDDTDTPSARAAFLLSQGILPVPGAVRKSSEKKKKDDTTDVLASLFA